MADEENIHQEYRFYRGAGLTLSATVISFATVLLGWGLSHAPDKFSYLYLLQILMAVGAILAAFSIQFCQFHGYRNQARGRFEDSWELRERANSWFRVLDKAVWIATSLIVATFLLSVIIWWPYGNAST